MRGSTFAKGRCRTSGRVLLAGLLAGLLLVPGQVRAMAGDGASLADTYSIAGQIYAGYWNGMMARNHGAGPRCKAGGQGCPLGDWQAFLDGLRGDSAERQLVRVNRYVNRVSYRDDRVNWGRRDYWAAPGEFFAKGGDCEDFAIAKYLSLKTLGFPVEELRLLILWDARRKIAHAVLAVERGGEELVLDNVEGRVLPLKDLPHYRVHYALNEKSVLRRLAGY